MKTIRKLTIMHFWVEEAWESCPPLPNVSWGSGEHHRLKDTNSVSKKARVMKPVFLHTPSNSILSLYPTYQSWFGERTADLLHSHTNTGCLLLINFLSFIITATLQMWVDISLWLCFEFPQWLATLGIFSYLLAICMSFKKYPSKCLAHFNWIVHFFVIEL